ncbi:MAG: hypothetical protein C0485_15150 [Pirellula sp.]|nr:hypothetical protein [Pirellula sp.]
MIQRTRSLLPLLVAAACVTGIAGCGESRPVAQVRGKVICKGGALPAAGIRMVRLQPTTDSDAVIRKGAGGSIKGDGSFELYTRRPGDGVHAGKYAVTFAFYKGAMDQKSLIPAKYANAATTPLHLDVKEDIDDLVLEIELTGNQTR